MLNRSTRRKTSWRKRENQKQTQPAYCVNAEDLNAAPRAFTTSPPLFLMHAYNIIPWENKNSILYNCT